MIKEIRLNMADIFSRTADEYNMMQLLKEKGFPTDGVVDLKPKAGLKYYEFHDYQTDEIVVQWEE